MSKNATHQDMTGFDGPVETGDAQAKRKLDKKQGNPENESNIPATVEVMPSGKVAEELTALFSGVEGLSEDFTTKATVIFEGAVSEYASTLRESMETEYSTKLQEATEAIEESYEAQLDRYLGLVVENYLKENAVAIDRGIRNEIAESVIESMVAIVENAGVELPEEKVDVAEELTKELEATEAKLNETTETVIDLRSQIKTLQLSEAFRTNTQGLSQDKVDRLARLTENMNFSDVEQFTSKLDILKESLTETPKNTVVEALTESTQENVLVESTLSDRQKAYLEASRNF